MKLAENILEDLEALEVSLVHKGANRRKFLLLKQSEMPMDELDTEIIKAEFDEALSAPLSNEDEINSLVEKEAVSPRGAQALKGIAKIWKQFKGDLPTNVLDTFSGLIGFSVSKNEEVSASPEAEVTKEENSMSEVEKKDEKAEATSVEEEVTKAKKADMEEEEEDEKKPPFMKKGKKEMAKSDSDSEEVSMENLPENIRKQVEDIFKSNEEIKKANAEIIKAQEETKKQLEQERDLRYTNEHIAKAEKAYKSLPVTAQELGPVVKAAEEKLSKEHFELFERVLKAAEEAMQRAKDFEEVGVNSAATSVTAYGKLNDIAKSYVEKSDKPLSYAQAFSRAVNENPSLYDEYMKERG